MKTSQPHKANLLPVKKQNSIKTKLELSLSRSFVKRTLVGVLLLIAASTSWGQIAQRGTATKAISTSASLTITKPTGVVSGDIMIANIGNFINATQTNAASSGWAVVAGTTLDRGRATLLYKIAGASEPSSYTFSVTASSSSATGAIIAFSGVDNSTPFDATAPSSWFTATSASLSSVPSLTSVSSGTAIILFGNCTRITTTTASNFASWTATSPSSFTELYDAGHNSVGNTPAVGAAWAIKSEIGTTGNGGLACTPNTTPRLLGGLMLALRPCVTVSAASSAPSVCTNSTLTNITHSTAGATGIGTATGLPTGVSASWISNTLTISGSPTVSGTFSYSIPLTGGCFAVNATGIITVLPSPTSVSATASSSTVCIGHSTDLTSSATFNNLSSTNAFNGFESGNSWSYTNTNGSTKSGTSASGDRPATSSFINSGSTSFWSNNASAVVTTSNFTGLSAYTNKYFQFDLASFSIGSASNGADGSDIVTVAISLDGGTTYSNEITIAGNSNAYWSFESGTGTAEITYDGNNSVTAFAPSGGGSRTTDGYGLVKINLPNNATQVRAKLTLLNNSSSEAWVIDDLILTETPNASYSWTSNPTGFTSTDHDPTVDPTETTTYTISATNTYGCSTSANSTITVNQPSTTISVNGVTIAEGDYLWNGKLNTNANVKNNWYVLNNGIYSEASQAPQATDEVFVVSATDAVSCVSNSNNMSIPAAGNFNSSNMNIGASASVSLGNGASLNVKGDFINDGNFNAGSGTVVMNGTSLQKIKGTAATTTFKNLTINNSNGVKLENAVVVDSVLLLTNGLLDLGSKHLTIGTTALISGTPGNSKMIVASGMGELRKQFSAGTYNPASFTFPVGTSNGTNKYNPVVLDFVSGTFGSNAYVGVRVQDQKNALLHPDNTTYINKNWIVEPNGDVTAFNYNIKLYFNPAAIAQGGDFVTTSGQTIGDLLPIKYSGGQWYQPVDGTFTNALAQGIAGVIVTNYLSWDGLTTFSEFGGVGGSNNPLPVELLSFSGKCNEGMVNLAWQTASEFNSSHFDVEKSTDGETWRVLTTVPSAGTSNDLLTYQAMDNNGTNGSNYYRLRQVDNDGKEKLYDPINVSCVETTAGYFTSYPNPSGNEFQVVVNNKEILGACTLNIVDVHGKVIDQRSIDMKEGINMFVISETLNPGIYFLNITNGTKTTKVIKHAIR